MQVYGSECHKILLPSMLSKSSCFLIENFLQRLSYQPYLCCTSGFIARIYRQCQKQCTSNTNLCNIVYKSIGSPRYNNSRINYIWTYILPNDTKVIIYLKLSQFENDGSATSCWTIGTDSLLIKIKHLYCTLAHSFHQNDATRTDAWCAIR